MEFLLKRTMTKRNQARGYLTEWLTSANQNPLCAEDLVSHLLRFGGMGSYVLEGRKIVGPHGFSLHADDVKNALYGKPENVFTIEVEVSRDTVPEPIDDSFDRLTKQLFESQKFEDEMAVETEVATEVETEVRVEASTDAEVEEEVTKPKRRSYGRKKVEEE